MASKYYYKFDVSNEYLGKFKTIKGATKSEARYKAEMQLEKWAEEEKRAREREAKQKAIADGKARAKAMNAELAEDRDSIKGMVQSALKFDFSSAWRKAYCREFLPSPFVFRQEPTLADAEKKVGGVPEKSFLEVFSKKRRGEREAQEAAAKSAYKELMSDYQREREKAQAAHDAEEQSRAKAIEEANETSRTRYEASIDDPEIFCLFLDDMVDIVSGQLYGDPDVNTSFSADSKAVQFDVALKSPDEICYVKEYRYVQSRNEIAESQLKKTDANALYDQYAFSVVISLLALGERVLVPKGIETIAVNGWVDGVDPRTGHDFTSCIVSVQASNDELQDIDFSKVDPKECVKGLKGLFAGSLRSLSPVKPVMRLNRDDPRFIESRDVLSEMDPSQNLAIMEWQDFEYLVRQLFESIFKTASGGEVRITRASRDAGVDAVAFDPDPIRGGKYVIQAKRYNGVVGVSAVRDLYGTMINEGAVKGILVTTSYYGKDSYEFAKDKPIQLIDGQQLLGLLEEQGYGSFNITLQKGQDAGL